MSEPADIPLAQALRRRARGGDALLSAAADELDRMRTGLQVISAWAWNDSLDARHVRTLCDEVLAPADQRISAP